MTPSKTPSTAKYIVTDTFVTGEHACGIVLALYLQEAGVIVTPEYILPFYFALGRQELLAHP